MRGESKAGRARRAALERCVDSVMIRLLDDNELDRFNAAAGGAPVRGPNHGSQPDRLMEHVTGLQQFLAIVTKADNIPIGAMMLLVVFFTYIALKQARRNDQLIEHGKRDQIIEEMRK